LDCLDSTSSTAVLVISSGRMKSSVVHSQVVVADEEFVQPEDVDAIDNVSHDCGPESHIEIELTTKQDQYERCRGTMSVNVLVILYTTAVQDDYTDLMVASGKGLIDEAKMLIDSGVGVDVQNKVMKYYDFMDWAIINLYSECPYGLLGRGDGAHVSSLQRPNRDGEAAHRERG
jgi:hypothetical protein